MKNKLSILMFPLLAVMMISCRKEINQIYYEGGTAPTLTASTTNVTMEPGLEANTAITLNWTNPDYMFTTGISSQDVTYTIEMDTAGGNFSSSKKFITVVSKDLSLTYTVGQLNSILGNAMLLQLNPRRSYTLQLRVTASINSTVPLASNVVSFSTMPFAPPAVVDPPASGTLYIVGSAVSYGWNNPLSDAPAQQFAQISPTEYQLTIPVVGDGEYKFISVNGSWDADKQWSIKTEQASGDPTTFSYDLYPNGGNARAPLTSGNYLIDVNFQIGKVTLTQQ